ncbi:unnamed protein product [Onchocerca flexuosa]|uniref:Uncharacterized protein n=1 Tax=Onchocerca flexuosa TaxID=387005 RepID=A0A183HK76_9BILA|nr:unnamed protein product [Onchocerca flexuosa]
MEKLRGILQHTVYEYVSRALFKKDRLMFSMRFIHGIHPSLFAQNVINSSEYEVNFI